MADPAADGNAIASGSAVSKQPRPPRTHSANSMRSDASGGGSHPMSMKLPRRKPKPPPGLPGGNFFSLRFFCLLVVVQPRFFFSVALFEVLRIQWPPLQSQLSTVKRTRDHKVLRTPPNLTLTPNVPGYPFVPVYSATKVRSSLGAPSIALNVNPRAIRGSF
mgnify:CR=1 FL=1